MKSLRDLLTQLLRGPAVALPAAMPVMSLKPGGDKEWRNQDGELHRLDGPAVECANGDKAWFRNDHLHREDGPAVEYTDGHKAWYRDGKLHRADGPAIERSDFRAWYLNGEPLTYKEIAILQARAKQKSFR